MWVRYCIVSLESGVYLRKGKLPFSFLNENLHGIYDFGHCHERVICPQVHMNII